MFIISPFFHRCSCSNIALKVNAKLSCSKIGEGRAWETGEGRAWNACDHARERDPIAPSPGIPWVAEVPTLVLGLDISQGLGGSSISVVAATVALDYRQCMRFAHTARCHTKLPFIVPEVFEEIVRVSLSVGCLAFFSCHCKIGQLLTLSLFFCKLKECYDHFLRANNVKPDRVLYFRGGVSEGQFEDILKREVMAIRKVS
jgi:hypothetical protein